MSRLRRPQDRDDFLAAHLLVRVCAARVMGTGAGALSIVQRCSTCDGPHGRPEVVGYPDLKAGLAHSRGVVAAAAGTVPIGIDVEAVPGAAGLTAGDLSVVLTEKEIAAVESAADPGTALLLVWVRKEACLKAGLVDLDGLGDFDLSGLPLDPPAGDLTLRGTPFGRWMVHDWRDGRAGAVGAVVVPSGTEVTLSGD